MTAPRLDPASGATADVIEPKPGSVAEVSRMRLRELVTISQRLGRLSKRRWDRYWNGAAILLFGAVLGGGFGLIPFFGAGEAPKTWAIVLYVSVLGLGVLLAILCGVAGMCVKGEREDSVSAIKADLDDLLNVYPEPGENPSSAQSGQ